MPLATIWILAGIVTWYSPAPIQTPSQPLIRPEYCQSVSVVRRQLPEFPPTRIAILGDRHRALAETTLGLERTGVPLVGFDGQSFVPEPCSDDIGIYYAIPMLARAARMPLTETIDLFLVTIVLVSVLSGAAGLMLICRSLIGRIVAISAAVLLGLLSLKIGDVYAIQSSVVLALVPWTLYFARKARDQWGILLFVFFASAAVAIANLMRSHAGTPVLIFMVWVFAFQLRSKRQFKLVIALTAIAALLLPLYYTRKVLNSRDAYLQKQGYTSTTAVRQHLFWHPVYLGLGYLSNDVVPGYLDEIAAAKVREMAPQVIYSSPEYEEYLKHEVIHIAVQHPMLVIETVAAKFGVIAGLILLCANVGLVAAYRYPKPWAVEVAFWNAIAFQSLFGIVAIPTKSYLLGLIALTTLYGAISMDEALQCAFPRDLFRLLRPRRALPGAAEQAVDEAVLHH